MKKMRKKQHKIDAKEKKGEKGIHQNDLFAQYRIERSPVWTGDLKKGQIFLTNAKYLLFCSSAAVNW